MEKLKLQINFDDNNKENLVTFDLNFLQNGNYTLQKIEDLNSLYKILIQYFSAQHTPKNSFKKFFDNQKSQLLQSKREIDNKPCKNLHEKVAVKVSVDKNLVVNENLEVPSEGISSL